MTVRRSHRVKFKDAELIGVPLIAVASRDTVNNGTLKRAILCNGENAEAVRSMRGDCRPQVAALLQ